MKAITDLFEECTQKYSNNVFLWEKRGTSYESTTYINTRDQVYRFAAGLIALGLNRGDRIALLSEGRNDWIISELGILYAGGINVPLSVKLNESDEIIFRLEHSGTRFIIVSNQNAGKISRIKKQLTSLEKIILLDKNGDMGEKEILFSDVINSGTDYLKLYPDEFRSRWQSVKSDDIANICYTSGTVADPKGIILTHRNYTANVEQSLTLMNIPEYFVSLVILPWDHAFAHTVGYAFMASGASIASVQAGKTAMDTLKNIPLNLKEIKPHFLLSVPSLAKNFKKQIEKSIRSRGILTFALFSWGLSVACTYNGIGWNKGKGLRILLKPLLMLFDKLLFAKVRIVFGGNLEFFIGGGAYLDVELQKFFYALGLPMYQGYGLSESSPVISCNSEVRLKMGSSGFLVKNLELQICDNNGKPLPLNEKGEIVVKGENVMAGYWKNPEATALALKDGWLYTGDLGSMDKDGFLYVYGRFKSLLISDDGEKYSPEAMEETFVSQSPLIEQCMLYNNQNKYTIALVVISKEAVKTRIQKQSGHPHMKEYYTVTALKHIEEAFYEYRTGKKHGHLFPQRWLPAAIGILPEAFTEENQLMNSTMKMVRSKIADRYADLIRFLYTPEGKNICNDRNIKNFEKYME